jgi:hypothetical protein
MVDKKSTGSILPEKKSSPYSQMAKQVFHALDVPADLTAIGLLGYAITHGMFGIGSKGGNVSTEGVSDEAGFQWLCNGIKAMGGSYGTKVSKSIIAVHKEIFDLDKGTAEIFRGLLLAQLKKDDMAKFFGDLVPTPPPFGDAAKIVVLANCAEPRILLAKELHAQVQAIQKTQNLTLEEAAKAFLQEAIATGMIPESNLLQGKKALKKAVDYFDPQDIKAILDSWDASLLEREGIRPLQTNIKIKGAPVPFGIVVAFTTVLICGLILLMKAH